MHEAAARHNIPSPFYPASLPVLPPIPLVPSMSSTKYSSPHSSPEIPSVATGVPPPLPEIRSRRIRKLVFTHGSLPGENKYVFQAPKSDPSTDNEE
jgi:hypothetical protein